jgi:4-amino-4-deoxy-L-arabinose transferase-like glycosyltransferase
MIRLLRALAVATLAGAFVYMVVHTLRWPLMQDAPVIHYVNFLTDHGFAPYREIGDMNMPGAYLIERLGVLLFGSGDVAFRIYDFFLMSAMVLAMIAIASPYDWLAGLFAGVLFAMIHASDGPKGAGQRDEVMATLMVVGLAFLFQSVRKARPGWMALGGFFFGMATAVKPTVAPLGLLLLLLIAVVLRRKGPLPRRGCVHFPQSQRHGLLRQS